jgi:hypothetical protein
VRQKFNTVKQSEERMTFLQLQERLLEIQRQENIPASRLINLELIFIDDDDKDCSIDLASLLVDDENNPLQINLRTQFSVNQSDKKENL